jgi:hypothetical protein
MTEKTKYRKAPLSKLMTKEYPFKMPKYEAYVYIGFIPIMLWITAQRVHGDFHLFGIIVPEAEDRIILRLSFCLFAFMLANLVAVLLNTRGRERFIIVTDSDLTIPKSPTYRRDTTIPLKRIMSIKSARQRNLLSPEKQRLLSIRTSDVAIHLSSSFLPNRAAFDDFHKTLTERWEKATKLIYEPTLCSAKVTDPYTSAT